MSFPQTGGNGLVTTPGSYHKGKEIGLGVPHISWDLCMDISAEVTFPLVEVTSPCAGGAYSQ